MANHWSQRVNSIVFLTVLTVPCCLAQYRLAVSFGCSVHIGAAPRLYMALGCQVAGGWKKHCSGQCCGSGMFIPDPDFFIPDPGSNSKKGGDKIFFVVLHFFVATNSQNWEWFFKTYIEKHLSQFTKNLSVFVYLKAFRNVGLGSEIRILTWQFCWRWKNTGTVCCQIPVGSKSFIYFT